MIGQYDPAMNGEGVAHTDITYNCPQMINMMHKQITSLTLK
jgi:hypothetical protein